MQLDPLAQSASKEEGQFCGALARVDTKFVRCIRLIRPPTYAATCETLSVYDLTVPLFKAVSGPAGGFMQRYLFGLLCCGGAIVYVLFDNLESRGRALSQEPRNRGRALSQKPRTASVRGAARPRGLISTAHSGEECDVLLCGMSGVGKSTLLHNIKVGTVEHSCSPVPREWEAFAEELRLHGPFGDNSFKVRHVDTCRLPCAG